MAAVLGMQALLQGCNKRGELIGDVDLEAAAELFEQPHQKAHLGGGFAVFSVAGELLADADGGGQVVLAYAGGLAQGADNDAEVGAVLDGDAH